MRTLLIALFVNFTTQFGVDDRLFSVGDSFSYEMDEHIGWNWKKLRKRCISM